MSAGHPARFSETEPGLLRNHPSVLRRTDSAGASSGPTPGLLPQIQGRMHFPALDGLRGVAILVVLVSHALPQYQFEARAGWRTVLHNVIASSTFGVDLFFVLSGFLITGILLDSKGSAHYYRSFFGRRIVRIFPLYYGTILVFWFWARFHGFYGDASFLHQCGWLLTYLLNFVIAWRNDWSFYFGQHSLVHFWSLAVEEQFYFFWPAVVLLCSGRTLRRICLLALPLALAWRLVSVYGLSNPLCGWVLLPARADGLALGACLAVWVRGDDEPAVARLAWPCLFLGTAIWLPCCYDGNLLRTVGVTGISVLSAGLLAASLYSFLGSWLSNAVLRTFGKYSYGIYVLHILILPYIESAKGVLGSAGFCVFFACVSLVAAWSSWHLYEKHFLKLKRFFPTGTSNAWTPYRTANIHKTSIVSSAAMPSSEEDAAVRAC